MNADRLLTLFERVADTPDAVDRLRRFIRDLAVRGNLVPQEPDEGTAFEALRVLLHRRKIPVCVEGPFVLPSNWVWARVSGLGEARLGKMLDKAKNKGLPRRYLRNANVRWFDFDLSNLFEMPFEDSELTEFELRAGDVLICEGGEPGRSAVWDAREAGIYFQKAIHRVRFSELVDPHYFVNALRASAHDGRLAEFFTGTGIKHFTGKGLDSYLFPLPPLGEQRRIVAKVDELMELCDQLEAARAEREVTRDRLATASLARLNSPDPDRATFARNARFALDMLPALTARLDEIRLLRQTVLNLAIRGKLVQPDSNAKIEVTPRERSPIGLPTGWRYTRLADLLSEETRNGYSRRPDDALDGTPILRISAATIRGDGVVAEEEHKLISGIDAKTRIQYGLRRGDLLACRFNGNKSFVGRMAIFRDNLGIAPIYPDKLIRVRLSPKMALPEFVQMAGDSDIVRGEIESACATTVGNWGISASNLRQVIIPLPTVTEQQRIVAKVHELMTLCDQLEASLSVADGTRSRLLDALLAEALAPVASELQVTNYSGVHLS